MQEKDRIQWKGTELMSTPERRRGTARCGLAEGSSAGTARRNVYQSSETARRRQWAPRCRFLRWVVLTIECKSLTLPALSRVQSQKLSSNLVMDLGYVMYYFWNPVPATLPAGSGQEKLSTK